jgi:molybdopterin molybdotransferase
LISGGISVGDYDFVGKALIDLEVGQLFYKVKQKPGKPLFFGKSKNTYVFALPGNPASALSCFYNYAYIALQKLAGNENAQLIKLRAKVRSNYDKKGDRAQFLKAFFNNDQVEILSSQASSMLNTFAMSNAFVYIPAEVSAVKKGELVDVILIPQS